MAITPEMLARLMDWEPPAKECPADGCEDRSCEDCRLKRASRARPIPTSLLCFREPVIIVYGQESDRG